MLTSLANWLDSTALAQLMREIIWAVPLTQTVHILSIGVVFSTSLLIVLRTLDLLGTDADWTLWSAQLGRWSAGALVVLLVTGALMVTGEPERSLLSSLFQIKMALLIPAATINWRLSHALRTAAAVHNPQETSMTALRPLAFGMLALWMLIIAAGRWIAYQ